MEVLCLGKMWGLMLFRHRSHIYVNRPLSLTFRPEVDGHLICVSAAIVVVSRTEGALGRAMTSVVQLSAAPALCQVTDASVDEAATLA